MSVLLAPAPAPPALPADTASAGAFKLSKCGSCIALCCRYFALEVDRPTTPGDFENLRWYMLHERVNVFIEGRRWFIQVFNRCSALGDDNRCTIYETRPKICRTYDNDGCDKDEAEEKTASGNDRVFHTIAELESFRDDWVKRYRARLRREGRARRATAARKAARKALAARKARKARAARASAGSGRPSSAAARRR